MVPQLRDLQQSLDPARLFRRAVGAAPDPWQARVLRSPAQRIILNCSRQSGKSTTTAALALHTAVYHAPALVLLVSPTLRQSSELFRKVVAGYHAIGRPSAATAETTIALHLANGSRIISLPGDGTTIRGYSGAALLIIDEASRVLDDTYTAIRPMVAVSNGRVILLSTPHGRRGFFFDTWQHGSALWHREEVPAVDCPRISADFLAEERAALGPWFAQEYESSFLDSEFQLFSSASIEAAVDEDLPALWEA